MSKLDLEIDDNLFEWVADAARREGVTPEELVELLINMESGLSDYARDGRKIKLRAQMYRGYETFLVDDRSYAGQI